MRDRQRPPRGRPYRSSSDAWRARARAPGRRWSTSRALRPSVRRPPRDARPAVPAAGRRRDQAGGAGRHRLASVRARPAVPTARGRAGRRDRRGARRAHQLGHRGALAEPPRARREGGGRGARAARTPRSPPSRRSASRRPRRSSSTRTSSTRSTPVDAEAKATPRTVGIVPVHLYGQPVDLSAVEHLASRLGLWVLEDCAQAQGAEWNGRRVGSFGRAGVFSFYPSKNLPGMGDGGAILTGDDEVVDRCRRLRDHGRVDRTCTAEIGFNLRFSELQAAALRVLLRRLDAMNAHRRALAEPLRARARRPAARAARRARARPPRVSPLRGAHPAPRRAGGISERARDPDRDPLSGADPSSARRRALLAAAAPAHGAAGRGDPHLAAVGRPHGRGDRSRDRHGARLLRRRGGECGRQGC